MSDSKRENDLRARQIKPAHPLSAIEKEAIRNSSNPNADVHEIGGEVTGATIAEALRGHKVSSND